MDREKQHQLERAALLLLGAAEHTLAHPETDSRDSQRWAREIVAGFGFLVEGGHSNKNQKRLDSRLKMGKLEK